MTTSQQPNSAADQAAPVQTAVTPRTGLSELVIPGILL